MSDNKYTREQMIDVLGITIGKLLHMELTEPVVFLVPLNGIRMLFALSKWLQLNKPLTDDLRKSTIEGLNIVIKESSSLDEKHIEIITKSLDRGQQQEEWEKASSTDEWINCY